MQWPHPHELCKYKSLSLTCVTQNSWKLSHFSTVADSKQMPPCAPCYAALVTSAASGFIKSLQGINAHLDILLAQLNKKEKQSIIDGQQPSHSSADAAKCVVCFCTLSLVWKNTILSFKGIFGKCENPA